MLPAGASDPGLSSVPSCLTPECQEEAASALAIWRPIAQGIESMAMNQRGPPPEATQCSAMRGVCVTEFGQLHWAE
ncbi:hypothetical protein MHYP_G00026320 [Metynnis hypsauchen]